MTTPEPDGAVFRLREALRERGFHPTGHGTMVDALAAVDTLQQERDAAREPLRIAMGEVETLHEAIANVIAERDAARRELQQLRDEVLQLAREAEAIDDIPMALRLRAALAGGTPATHNNQENQ